MGKSNQSQWIILLIFVIPISSLLTWEATSIDLPSKLSLAASATIDQQILYLFGGYIDGDTDKPSNKVYKYHTNHNTWIMSPATIPNSLPIYCYQCTAIINQTLIYIVTQHTNTIYIFDTTNDSFLSSQHIATPLIPIYGSYTAVTNDESGQFMYVISYEQSDSNSIPHLQRYNAYINQWFPSRRFPFPSHGFIASIYYNNILFVFAGHTKHCNKISNKCIISNHDRICGYDIRTHLWSCYSSTLNENKYGASVIMNNINHKIYIIAGWTDNHFSKTVDVFDPNTFDCSVIEPLPNIGGLVTTTFVNDELMVFGGRNLSASSLQHVYGGFILRNVNETTLVPTMNPTDIPSMNPSEWPSSNPSNNPTVSPSFVPTHSPSNISANTSHSPSFEPSNIPSAHPTDKLTFISSSPSTAPSIHPTLHPSIHTYDPSNQPSSMRISDPATLTTNHTSISPSYIASTNPSNVPSTSYNPSPIPSNEPTLYYDPTKLQISFDSLNSTYYVKTELFASSHILSDYHYILCTSATISLILFVLCSLYLCIFTSKRAREFGEVKWNDFIAYSSLLLKIGMMLQIVDIISDYIYSISLITASNIDDKLQSYHALQTIAWLSLMCGVIGSILFIVELFLARKLYSQIPVLHEQLKTCHKIENEEIMLDPTWIPQYGIIHAIRIRKVDIDIFAILMSCFEDIPQITLVIMATSILSEWSHIGVLSLMFSVSSCMMKFLRVILDLLGCTDDVIDVFGYEGVDDVDASRIAVTFSIHRMDDISNAAAKDEESHDNSIGLMEDSDEADDEMEEDDVIDRSNNRKRSLKISRRGTLLFNKHRLLMIPEEEEDIEEWSEF